MMNVAFLVPIILVFPASAQVVTYEADAFPDDLGWKRSNRPYLPERWLDSGWFIQQTEMRDQGPEDDIYRRSIAEVAGVPAFFVEWSMVTDGTRQGIPDVAPAALIASGTTGVFDHITIAEDQVCLVDSYLDVYWFDVEPGVPHTYRVEVRDKAHTAFIDGEQIYARVAPGSYPTPDSVIVFGARAPGETATTRWDYIRFGVIPDDAGPGDLNCDGSINGQDITPSITALVSPDAYGRNYPACKRMLADCNADGSVNGQDIAPFVDLLK